MVTPRRNDQQSEPTCRHISINEKNHYIKNVIARSLRRSNLVSVASGKLCKKTEKEFFIQSMNKLLVISGPTATGKTALACELAQHIHAELISADSRQVYKGMDIITGKDFYPKKILKTYHLPQPQYNIDTLDAYEIQQTPIWMYDVITIDQEWSVSHYHALVKQLLADMQKRNVLPIVVGGTGLYIKSILETIETVDIPKNSLLRNQLLALSVEELEQKLQTVNAAVYSSLNNSDKHNPRRLIRKIEIEEYKRIHPDYEKQLEKKESSYDVLHIGLTAPEWYLSQSITSRVEERLQQGAVQEVQSLTNTCGWNYPAFDAIGYREWKEYLDHPSQDAYTQAKALWTAHEIAYTKKQTTWFNKQQNIFRYTITDNDFRSQIQEKFQLWYTTNR